MASCTLWGCKNRPALLPDRVQTTHCQSFSYYIFFQCVAIFLDCVSGTVLNRLIWQRMFKRLIVEMVVVVMMVVVVVMMVMVVVLVLVNE